jgi:hypothetical protein
MAHLLEGKTPYEPDRGPAGAEENLGAPNLQTKRIISKTSFQYPGTAAIESKHFLISLEENSLIHSSNEKWKI